ncbi:MAG TPA: geranylgeranyl reductase family protein [Kineosporiaceae bacterium]|nr:geranylgeranyl reductase family protein [Kineosporiaceae bacterium]
MPGTDADDVWDVVVVGAGPAGSSAALAAARAGARTLVLDRARFPRYKTCGGGLVGSTLAALPTGLRIPVRQEITEATFTLHGRQPVTRRSRPPFLTMVDRADFDETLLRAAIDAGAAARLGAMVLTVAEADHAGDVRVETRDGPIRARFVVGADGSASRIARHVGVVLAEVDLGLELELESGGHAGDWQGRLHLDFGTAPGSYGWVFPKGDRLTVGVIAAKGGGEAERRYLDRYVAALGLDRARVLVDSGHLTRCRAPGSPLGRGRVLVAGDAAGLLDPWMREGISFAVRSGLMAGRIAADAAREQAARARGEGGGAGSAGVEHRPRPSDVAQAEYRRWVDTTLTPEMDAGRVFLAGFRRRPDLAHLAVARTRPGWAAFRRMCRGTTTLPLLLQHPVIRASVALGQRL